MSDPTENEELTPEEARWNEDNTTPAYCVPDEFKEMSHPFRLATQYCQGVRSLREYDSSTPQSPSLKDNDTVEVLAPRRQENGSVVDVPIMDVKLLDASLAPNFRIGEPKSSSPPDGLFPELFNDEYHTINRAKFDDPHLVALAMCDVRCDKNIFYGSIKKNSPAHPTVEKKFKASLDEAIKSLMLFASNTYSLNAMALGNVDGFRAVKTKYKNVTEPPLCSLDACKPRTIQKSANGTDMLMCGNCCHRISKNAIANLGKREILEQWNHVILMVYKNHKVEDVGGEAGAVQSHLEVLEWYLHDCLACDKPLGERRYNYLKALLPDVGAFETKFDDLSITPRTLVGNVLDPILNALVRNEDIFNEDYVLTAPDFKSVCCGLEDFPWWDKKAIELPLQKDTHCVRGDDLRGRFNERVELLMMRIAIVWAQMNGVSNELSIVSSPHSWFRTSVRRERKRVKPHIFVGRFKLEIGGRRIGTNPNMHTRPKSSNTPSGMERREIMDGLQPGTIILNLDNHRTHTFYLESPLSDSGGHTIDSNESNLVYIPGKKHWGEVIQSHQGNGRDIAPLLVLELFSEHQSLKARRLHFPRASSCKYFPLPWFPKMFQFLALAEWRRCNVINNFMQLQQDPLWRTVCVQNLFNAAAIVHRQQLSGMPFPSLPDDDDEEESEEDNAENGESENSEDEEDDDRKPKAKEDGVDEDDDRKPKAKEDGVDEDAFFEDPHRGGESEDDDASGSEEEEEYDPNAKEEDDSSGEGTHTLPTVDENRELIVGSSTDGNSSDDEVAIADIVAAKKAGKGQSGRGKKTAPSDDARAVRSSPRRKKRPAISMETPESQVQKRPVRNRTPSQKLDGHVVPPQIVKSRRGGKKGNS